MAVDTREYDALVKRFTDAGKNAQVELKRALISSQRAAKTEFSRAARAIYNIKNASFQRNFSVTKPDQSRLSYTVVGEKKGINLASFGARQNKKGIVVQIRKDTGKKLIKGAFFPSAGDKSGVPFKRDGRPRLPVSVLYGPSAADMLAAKPVRDPAVKTTKTRLNDDITKRINRITRRG